MTFFRLFSRHSELFLPMPSSSVLTGTFLPAGGTGLASLGGIRSRRCAAHFFSGHQPHSQSEQGAVAMPSSCHFPDLFSPAPL